jgi:hypothetical protein
MNSSGYLMALTCRASPYMIKIHPKAIIYRDQAQGRRDDRIDLMDGVP